jgi:aryl-alcohol dehydrogenase-like predicted oxidoreductase
VQTRGLGRTGYQVSEVGFGAWGLGGNMWLGAKDEEGRRALREALDGGVTFIDTALVYGDGHSERLIARVLAERAERAGLVVATKIPPKDRVWPGKERTPFIRAFPADHIIHCVEESLRNLALETLQIEQLHVWHDAWLDSDGWHESRRAMERLREQGKVLHWGVSINAHAPATAMRLASDPLIETVQVIYNVFDRSPEKELFALAREKHLGVIARVPFNEGTLTGAIGPDTIFPPGDWRESYFRGTRRAEAATRAAALRPLLGEEAATLAELALRFCLSRPEVSSVIPGMRRATHARANAAVSDGRLLSAELLDRLRAHAWDKNWYGD